MMRENTSVCEQSSTVTQFSIHQPLFGWSGMYLAARGPLTPGFHPTHARCCGTTNHPGVSRCLTPILCAKRRVSGEPLPQVPLHCVAVQCLLCSHSNTPHLSHCAVSKGIKGATLTAIQMCSSSTDIWGPVFAVSCYCARYRTH